MTSLSVHILADVGFGVISLIVSSMKYLKHIGASAKDRAGNPPDARVSDGTAINAH
jgi:hypothetical protein